jgi:hypothetical protein
MAWALSLPSRSLLDEQPLGRLRTQTIEVVLHDQEVGRFAVPLQDACRTVEKLVDPAQQIGAVALQLTAYRLAPLDAALHHRLDPRQHLQADEIEPGLPRHLGLGFDRGFGAEGLHVLLGPGGEPLDHVV